MSQSFILILLILALVLPVLGASVLRLLGPRLSPGRLYGAAALIFGVAFVSVLALARSNISSLQVGGLSLLLPVVAPSEHDSEHDVALLPLTGVPGTEVPTVVLPPTELPAATPAPTVTPVPSATPVPTTAPPTTIPPTAIPPTAVPSTAVPPPPPAPRTYTVQPGDTLRGIAEQFNVGVQALIDANQLTPQQADALRVGQVLVIP